MNKKKGAVIGLITVFFSFVVALFLFRAQEIKPSTFDIALGVMGILGLTVASYFLFRTKKLYLFLGLGLVLSLSGTGVVRFLWKPYPQIASILYPLCVLLAFVFFVVAVIKMSKEFLGRFKR
jgi:hypothetical protein